MFTSLILAAAVVESAQLLDDCIGTLRYVETAGAGLLLPTRPTVPCALCVPAHASQGQQPLALRSAATRTHERLLQAQQPQVLRLVHCTVSHHTAPEQASAHSRTRDGSRGGVERGEEHARLGSRAERACGGDDSDGRAVKREELGNSIGKQRRGVLEGRREERRQGGGENAES